MKFEPNLRLLRWVNYQNKVNSPIAKRYPKKVRTDLLTLLFNVMRDENRLEETLRGLQCRVPDFYRWYLILVIRLRRFRIFFQNASSVIRSRARILPIIGGESFSQKRETGTKRGWSTYFIYFCPGMGKDPHYLYFHGWWPYNVAQ